MNTEMKKLLVLFGLLTILLSSCTSPLDKTFNEETVENDIEAIRSELDSNEINLLAGSLIRLGIQQKNLSEMTYREILENGKNWKAEQDRLEAEQKALAEKAAREEAERVERLNKAVIVTCFEKGFVKVDYQEYITYKFAIQNKSEKDMRAIKGSITFTNLFDDEIKTLSFVYDEPIEAGKTVNWEAQTDYNKFIDEDKSLKSKDLEDIKVVWKPEKVIFGDGSTLE